MDFAPLEIFCRRAKLALPTWRTLTDTEVPEPYAALLLHDRDMTPTLEEYHRAGIEIQMIQQVDIPEYSRMVQLKTLPEGMVVEFGAITIELRAFSEPARRDIRAGRIPLGNIFRHYEVEHRCHPRGAFAVRQEGLVRDHLGPARAGEYYGRCNLITGLDGVTLARVVEILPALP